jgi:hypothetical protein
MFEQLKKYLAFLLMAALLAAVVFGYVKYRGYQNELADLRNQVASKDKTVEELKNTYTKLAIESDGLKASNADLAKLLKKTDQDLIAETQARVYWKGKYEYDIAHHPAAPGDPGSFKPPATQVACTDKPQTYSGTQDIGLLKLTVDTFTVDPSYQTKLKIEPGSKPLILTLDLTRDAKKQWHQHVQSSDDRIGVEIGINSVNIEPLQLRWYERLKVHIDVGAGNGIITGAGGAVQFGAFDLGPSIWAVPTLTPKPFYGINFSWAPFKSK